MQVARIPGRAIIFLSVLFLYLCSTVVTAQDTAPPLLTKIFTNSMTLNNLIIMDPDGNFEQVRKMNDELIQDIALFNKQYGNMKLPPKNYVTLCYCEKASVTIVNNSVLRVSRDEVKCQLKGTANAVLIQRYQYDLSTKTRTHIDTQLLTTWNTPLNFSVEKFSGWMMIYNGRKQVKSPFTGYEFLTDPQKNYTIAIQPFNRYVDQDKTNYSLYLSFPGLDFTPAQRPNGESLADCNLAIDDSLTGYEFSKAIENGYFKKTFKTNLGYCIESVFDVEIKFKPTYQLVVTPKDGFESSGPNPDGVFVPGSKTYTLKNRGNNPLDYKVTKTAQWLDVSNSTGTLAPGSKTSVKISINESAKKLKEEEYKDEVKFINMTDGSGNTSRKVILEVGEEQKWRLFFTGYELRQYEIPKWKTPDNKPIRFGGRFDYKLRVEFIIKKKKGKWKYKEGLVTIADINYGTLYDPTYWGTKNEKSKYFYKITSMKGKNINGTVDGNKVRLFWPRPQPPPERYVEALFRKPCIPMPECSIWKAIEYASDEFLDRAGDHYLVLKDGWVSPQKKPFTIERPNDELRWLNYRYTLKKIAPK